MTVRSDWVVGALAVAAAAAWPLTAYAVSPVVLPVFLLALVTAATVLLRPAYGIALVLVLAPVANVVVGQPLLLWLIPGLAFGVLAYGALISALPPVAARGLVLALLAFGAVTAVSAALALDPSGAVKGPFVLFAAAATLLGVLQFGQERQALVVVAGGAVAGLLLASAHGVVQHVLETSSYGFVAGGAVVDRAHGAFVSPNKYGGYVAILIPLAAALAVSRHARGPLRWLAVAALGLAVPALVFSYSRGAMVGLVVGSVLWLALVRPRALPYAAIAAAVALVVVAPATLEERFAAQENSDALVERGDVWSAALDIYAERPLLGAGVGNFSEAYARLPSTLSDASQRRLFDWQGGAPTIPFHAHNAYLNLLAEQGIVGLAAFLLLAGVAVGVIVRGCRVADPLGRVICLGAGAAWLTWAVRNLVDVALYEEVTFPLFALTAVAAGFVALDRRTAAAA